MIEKNICWMFSIILLLMILISIFGGSIRYRENFLDEVTGYDLEPSMNNDDEYASISLPSANDTAVEEENIIEVDEENIVQEEQPPSQPQQQQSSQIPNDMINNNNMSVVEGFSGDEWASSQW